MQFNSSEKKPETVSSSSSSTIPTLLWIDLPNDLAVLILELLPLPDYIRFASVCKKWRSIQIDHRRLHSPNPPPMLKSFPWIISDPYINALRCYLFPDSKSFLLNSPNTARYNQSFCCSKGWIFFISDSKNVMLLNPITNFEIQLPPLPPIDIIVDCALYCDLSASPLDPNCIAIILDPFYKKGCLCLVGQNQQIWTSFSHKGRLNGVDYCNGKFYYYLAKKSSIINQLSVIDLASANPSSKTLEMDCSEMVSEMVNGVNYLLEFRGEIMNIVAIYSRLFIADEFQVFRADFCGMKWRRMYNLVDLVFFVSRNFTVCLSASDVGCEGNRVYYMPDDKKGMVFDMGSKQWIDGLYVPYGGWLLPSLDFVDHA